MPYQEINISREFFDQPYFENITKATSPYYLNNTVPQFNGQVYIITGPKTFSAGQILASTIADNNLGKIVGKPTGNKPTTQTGASGFKLPNTKKIIALSYFFMERPDKSKNNENSLYPDIEFYRTFDEYMKGEDALMEFIIDEGKKQP
jgi:C-terminal processing protease CtpA/Prc